MGKKILHAFPFNYDIRNKLLFLIILSVFNTKEKKRRERKRDVEKLLSISVLILDNCVYQKYFHFNKYKKNETVDFAFSKILCGF